MDHALTTLVDTTTRTPGSKPESYATAVFAPFRDAWMAARARLGMLATAGSAVAGVSVEAYRGSLILAGDVGSTDARVRAEIAARAASGASGVSNQIRVRGTHCLRPGASDAEVRTAVAARLRHAPELRGSVVTVDSVYDGVVRVVGAAEDARTAALVFDLTVEVPGVRRVINDVTMLPIAAANDADAA